MPGTFSNFAFGYLWRVEKETSKREGKWKFNVESFAPFDPKMI